MKSSVRSVLCILALSLASSSNAFARPLMAATGLEETSLHGAAQQSTTHTRWFKTDAGESRWKFDTKTGEVWEFTDDLGWLKVGNHTCKVDGDDIVTYYPTGAVAYRFKDTLAKGAAAGDVVHGTEEKKIGTWEAEL